MAAIEVDKAEGVDSQGRDAKTKVILKRLDGDLL